MNNHDMISERIYSWFYSWCLLVGFEHRSFVHRRGQRVAHRLRKTAIRSWGKYVPWPVVQILLAAGALNRFCQFCWCNIWCLELVLLSPQSTSKVQGFSPDLWRPKQFHHVFCGVRDRFCPEDFHHGSDVSWATEKTTERVAVGGWI